MCPSKTNHVLSMKKRPTNHVWTKPATYRKWCAYLQAWLQYRGVSPNPNPNPNPDPNPKRNAGPDPDPDPNPVTLTLTLTLISILTLTLTVTLRVYGSFLLWGYLQERVSSTNYDETQVAWSSNSNSWILNSIQQFCFFEMLTTYRMCVSIQLNSIVSN